MDIAQEASNRTVTENQGGSASEHGDRVDATSLHDARAAHADRVNNMSRAKILGTWLSIACGSLCVFLDEGIIATAIPQITDDFHSLSDVGWYGSAYLMTLCAFQLVFGRLYSRFNVKVVFLASLAVFEIGSLLCAVSPASAAFIVGRTIAGCGGGGIMSGAIALIAASLPAKGLPLYVGAQGVVYGVAAVVGPVLGGVITNSYLTWRWCFYINLPLAAPPAITTVFFIGVPPVTGEAARPVSQKLRDLDYLGIALMLPGIVSFLLAVQFGGTLYEWSDGRTIGCFVIAGVFLVAFVVEQFWMAEKALVPPRIAKMRVVLFGSIFTFCLESAFLTLVYYVPLWFQAIQGVSPEESGVRYLALCGAFIVSIFTSGWIVTKLGYYQPFMLVGTVLVSVGSGLLSTLTADSGANMWIPYQIVAGLGIGASTEQSRVAIQSLLGEADAPIGVAVALFCQNLGPTTLISVANSVFTRTLTTQIREQLPDVDPHVIIDSGATVLHNLVSPKDLQTLREVYNQALTRTFVVAAAVAAASVFGLVGIETKKIPTGDDASKKDDQNRVHGRGDTEKPEEVA